MTAKRVYFFYGADYRRFDVALDGVLPVYPLSIGRFWPGLFTSNIDAGFPLATGKVYYFSGAQYVRYDARRNAADAGYPKPIAGNWPGVNGTGFENGIDAALNWGNGQIYWFKGPNYMRLGWTPAGGWVMDPGYPKPIAGNWPGVAGTGLENGIDAAINWGNGNRYWFKNDQYIRMIEDSSGKKSMDTGYPKPLAGNWSGVPAGMGAAVEWPMAEVVPGGFAVPGNRTGVALSPDGSRKGDPFVMNIDFADGPHPTMCPVGEYRQFVQGAFTLNGVDQAFQLANPNGGPPVLFSRTTFREDGLAAPPAGASVFYGHRDDPSNNGDSSDAYLPDRLTGCQYRGTDSPGIPTVAGMALQVDFIGQAVDQATGGQVVQSATWTVSITI